MAKRIVFQITKQVKFALAKYSRQLPGCYPDISADKPPDRRWQVCGLCADIFRPAKYRDTDGLRPECGHSRRGHGHGYGLPTECLRRWMRSRTGRGHARLRTGHGPGSDTACPWLRTSARAFSRTDCGFTATVSRTQKPRSDEE